MTTERHDYLIPKKIVKAMSPGQKKEYEQLLGAKRAMRSPLDYALHVDPKAKRHRHSEYINSVLMALVEHRLYKDGPGPESAVVDVSEQEPLGRRVHPETGEPALSQLMISLPPRIGKSYMVGEMFPAWFLTKFPDETVMYISHGAGLATAITASARDHIAEHPELGAVLKPEHQGRDEWSLVGSPRLSGMIAKGSDGVPTGRGGNLLIDDLWQTGDEAMSDTGREKKIAHYGSSLRPRVNPGCWKILMGTRWHDGDLHGHLSDTEGDEWFIINIPAVSFDTVDEDGFSVDPDTGQRDVFSRRPGEAVCPDIAPLSYYIAAQKADPFWYEAEYLGKPSGVSGNMFPKFNYYTRLQTDDGRSVYELLLPEDNEYIAESDCVRFGIVDLAISDKQTADWTVFGVFDMDYERRLFVREIIRKRVTGADHEDFIRTNAAIWKCQVVGIEDVTYGTVVIQEMIIAGGVPIWSLAADKNKKIRAIPAANLFKKKLMFVDRDSNWRNAYEAELKQFDRGKHDDQVDVTGYSTRLRDLLATRPAPKQPVLNPLTGMQRVLSELADSVEKKERIGMVINGES